MKRVLLGSDHAGLKLKKEITTFLKDLGYDIVDVGTHENKSCHYPDFAEDLAKQIKKDQKGILFCGSGIGISIAGIKSGLRCSVAFNEYTAKECQKAGMQVMAMGDRVITPEIGKIMVDAFLQGY